MTEITTLANALQALDTTGTNVSLLPLLDEADEAVAQCFINAANTLKPDASSEDRCLAWTRACRDSSHVRKSIRRDVWGIIRNIFLEDHADETWFLGPMDVDFVMTAQPWWVEIHRDGERLGYVSLDTLNSEGLRSTHPDTMFEIVTWAIPDRAGEDWMRLDDDPLPTSDHDKIIATTVRRVPVNSEFLVEELADTIETMLG